jgi:uncharacterized protein (DUF1501 family)
MLHRRAFLTASGVVAWGMTLPSFLSRTAAAAPALDKRGAKDTILVVVELTGGNDGLNTVVPFKDETYRKLRPSLALAESSLKKLNDSVGLHPSMDGFAGLYQGGELCVVQGVGYPNPTQSHFRSMDIWQAGSKEETLTEGWLGKALKGMPAGTQAFHLKHANQTSPLAFEGAPMRVPSVGSLEEFQLKTAAASGADKVAKERVIEGAVAGGKKPGLLDFVSKTAASTYASSKRLAEIGKGYEPKVPYPVTPLADRLKLAAQLIDAGLGARLFYVSIDGWDTHANQAPAHAGLLGQVSGAMTAFYKDLKARGHGDRVLMMTFSEFGRRAKENGSKGTDHGSGAPMFLVGGKVKGGVVGAHPSLTKLEDGNLVHHTDFRQVYASVLEGWLGVASKDVLGKKFAATAVLK